MTAGSKNTLSWRPPDRQKLIRTAKAECDHFILDRIDAAITGLPELTREVFIMHRFEDLGYDWIAHRLGIGINEVERQMALAIDQIHIKVEEMVSSASVDGAESE